MFSPRFETLTQRAGCPLILLVLVAFVATQTGCNKPKTSSKLNKSPGSTTSGESKPSTSPEGEEPSGGNDGTEDPSVDPRITAMENAYDSLVRGGDTSVDTVLALGQDTRSVLVRAIESENVRATSGALDALVRLDVLDDEVKRMLKLALENSADAIRMEALDAIAALGAKELSKDVTARLDDEELTVRATACDAIVELGKPSKNLLERLLVAAADSEDVVRAACASAFGQVADRDEWRPRVAKLLLEDSVPAKEGALRALGFWRDDTSFDLIAGRLTDRSPVVVAMALAALSRFRSVEAARQIERFVADERLSVRVEAVAAMARLPKDEVRRLAYEALKDREAIVRIEAATLLTRFGEDPETFIRLHALLRDENEGVRSAAVLAIDELGDARSFGPVAERLKVENDGAVRTEMVEALIAADPQRSVPHLIDRLEKAKGPEKTAVLVGLRNITEQGFPAKRAPWQEWYESTQNAAP